MALSYPRPESVLHAFLHATEEDAYVEFVKDYSSAISNAISTGYKDNMREDKIVEEMVTSLKVLGRVSTGSFAISARSNFIHGRRSWVTFPKGAVRKRKELGDAVFIVSVIHNNHVYFRRMTINQVKKSRDSLSWKLDSDQLFLLTAFPKFRGEPGSWICGKDHSVDNLSECLGSYGMIYADDFIFISAFDLSAYVGVKQQIRRGQLTSLGNLLDISSRTFMPVHSLNSLLFTNCKFALNSADFASKFLRLGIGEVLYIPPGWDDNPQARELIDDIRRSIKADLSERFATEPNPSRETEYLKDAWHFLSLPYVGQPPPNDLPPPDNFLDGEGGTGVFHVVIEIKEPSTHDEPHTL